MNSDNHDTLSSTGRPERGFRPEGIGWARTKWSWRLDRDGGRPGRVAGTARRLRWRILPKRREESQDT